VCREIAFLLKRVQTQFLFFPRPKFSGSSFGPSKLFDEGVSFSANSLLLSSAGFLRTASLNRRGEDRLPFPFPAFLSCFGFIFSSWCGERTPRTSGTAFPGGRGFFPTESLPGVWDLFSSRSSISLGKTTRQPAERCFFFFSPNFFEEVARDFLSG